MRIAKLKVSQAYQVEVAKSVYILFDEFESTGDVDIFFSNQGKLSGAIYDASASKEFKKLWSELK